MLLIEFCNLIASLGELIICTSLRSSAKIEKMCKLLMTLGISLMKILKRRIDRWLIISSSLSAEVNQE